MQLFDKVRLPAVGLATPFDCGIERIHCKRKAPAGGIDRTRFRHWPQPPRRLLDPRIRHP
jgi:hypothetical protein